MQKVIFSIGVLFILFSFIFVGLGACSKDGGCVDDGYISCGNTGKCCPMQYPYHGGNGKCYETMSDCQQKGTKCTQCGSGNSSGGGSSGGSGGGGNNTQTTCPSGRCLVRGFGCCPGTHPVYYMGKCYRTIDECKRELGINFCSPYYTCSKWF